MPKRERIRVLKERIRAGGATAYYDDPKYDDDTISDTDAATLLTVSDQFDLHDYSDNRHGSLQLNGEASQITTDPAEVAFWSDYYGLFWDRSETISEEFLLSKL